MTTWLVTGANRGIGLALARQLTRRGDRVVGTARAPDAAPDLADTGARVVAIDVNHPASVARLQERLEDAPIDVLVNNAGKGGRGPGIEELDFEIVREFFEVNALGPLRVVQALLPNLRRGRGRIVAQISSVLGSVSGNTQGGLYPYRGSKAALNTMTRSLARELEPEGFRGLLVHPGWVRTAIGGPRAPLDPPEGARGVLSVLDRATAADNGRFVTTTGEDLPW